MAAVKQDALYFPRTNGDAIIDIRSVVNSQEMPAFTGISLFLPFLFLFKFKTVHCRFS